MARTKGAGNRSKKEKPIKDKDAPKKGKSAFFFFLAANLEDLKKKNPSLAHKEAVSELSKEWKKLSTAGKKSYIDLANKEKERFQKEKEVYQAKKQRENEGLVNEKRIAKKGAENEPKVAKKEKIIPRASKSCGRINFVYKDEDSEVEDEDGDDTTE